jgi:hypothetical protein
MGPFNDQGGSAWLEDAVVLAQSLAGTGGDDDDDKLPGKKAARRSGSTSGRGGCG